MIICNRIKSQKLLNIMKDIFEAHNHIQIAPDLKKQEYICDTAQVVKS